MIYLKPASSVRLLSTFSVTIFGCNAHPIFVHSSYSSLLHHLYVFSLCHPKTQSTVHAGVTEHTVRNVIPALNIQAIPLQTVRSVEIIPLSNLCNILMLHNLTKYLKNSCVCTNLTSGNRASKIGHPANVAASTSDENVTLISIVTCIEVVEHPENSSYISTQEEFSFDLALSWAW